MDDDSKFDAALAGVLSSCGRPEIFLDTVFGFLYRRTNFYKVDGIGHVQGLLPGYASKVVYKAFMKYETKAREDDQKLLELQASANQAATTDVPEAVVKEEVVSIGGEEVTMQRRGDEIIVQADGVPATKTAATTSTAAANSAGASCHSKDRADSYNGAERDNYNWTQSHADIDVRVKVTNEHTKFAVSWPGGKSLKVTALQNGTPVTLVEGELLYKIKESDTFWTVERGKHLHISMEKAESRWWDSLLKTEAKISLNGLELTKPFTDLGVEEQMKLRQLQQEALDKLKGKPPKRDVDDVLKAAWNAEGSPFKGTPYDPSLVNMQGDI